MVEKSKLDQCREEYERLFAHNGCPTTLLIPGAEDEALTDNHGSHFGGLPTFGPLTEWPRCRGCDGAMTFLAQVHAADHPDLKTLQGTDLLQLFWCDDYCFEAPTTFEGTTLRDGPVLLVYGKAGDRTLSAPEGLGRLPARPMTREAAIDVPAEGVAREIWWGSAYSRFYGRHDFDVYCEMLDQQPGTNHDRPKIGGIASWRQGAERAECIYCKEIGFWEHDHRPAWHQGPTGQSATAHSNELLFQFVSDDINLVDCGGIYVLACECRNPTIHLDFS